MSFGEIRVRRRRYLIRGTRQEWIMRAFEPFVLDPELIRAGLQSTATTQFDLIAFIADLAGRKMRGVNKFEGLSSKPPRP
jgi:hypothetical protein